MTTTHEKLKLVRFKEVGPGWERLQVLKCTQALTILCIPHRDSGIFAIPETVAIELIKDFGVEDRGYHNEFAATAMPPRLRPQAHVLSFLKRAWWKRWLTVFYTWLLQVLGRKR